VLFACTGKSTEEIFHTVSRVNQLFIISNQLNKKAK
jgi:hypothetical protein